jgi:hypothetical protein
MDLKRAEQFEISDEHFWRLISKRNQLIKKNELLFIGRLIRKLIEKLEK